MRPFRASTNRLAAIAVLVLITSCDNTPPTGPRNDAARNASNDNIVGSEPRPSLDDEFVNLGREISGFGGMYLDADQHLVVVLTSAGDEKHAASRAADFMARKEGSAKSKKIRFARGQYTFQQLKQWEQRAMSLFATPGVVYTDVDEVKNKLSIGVASHAMEAPTHAGLVRLGIPPSAVVITIAEVPRFAYTLSDIVRPILGGLRIQTLHTSKVCTMGFNARTPVGTPSLVVNSHCTDTQGGTESTRINQPGVGKIGTEIGIEAADPVYSVGGTCPSGKRCRYSDAALATIRAFATNNWSLEVARTTVEGTTTAGNTVVGMRLPVVGELASPLVGTLVRKTGFRTGSTRGTISNACMNTPVGGSNVYLYCQYVVTAASLDGDSGSPVYTWSGVAGTGATLAGILWGFTSTQFYFSSMGNIERELGALTTQ
jgi:hypothetical protein